MKKVLCLLIAFVLVGVCGWLGGCAGGGDGEIRLVEVTHSLFYAPQYVAMAMGYFESEGLTLELSNGSGADNVMTALLTGEADIGLMGCEANVYVFLQGKKDYPKVIAQLTKRDGSFLVGRTPQRDFNYSSVAGKTVLMGRKGGMPAMILEYVMGAKGLTNGKNVTMDYSIQFGALAPAFTGGTGDYVPLFEPTASQMEKEGKGYIVSAIGLDSGEIPYTCYTATEKFAKNNPEKVEKFLRAVWKGTEFALTQSAEIVAEKIAPFFDGTSRDLLVKAIANYQKCDVWTTTPVTDEKAFARLLDVMKNAGELQGEVKYDDIVDNGAAKKIKEI